jgi:hypothetical protein
MTDAREHVQFDVLNDYVDGRLDSRERRVVEEHVGICEECSAELADLRLLLEDVASLPKSVLPADELWAGIRGSIEKSKEIVLPIAHARTNEAAAAPGMFRFRDSRSFLAVAAVLLVVLSSGITTLVLRSGESQVERPGGPPANDVGAPTMLPASFMVAEGKYVSTIDDLRTAFEAQRDRLSPATVKTVDHSLAVIDAAIQEARTALLADPGNRTLVDLLSASYQRKLDLLRRTSELTSRL